MNKISPGLFPSNPSNKKTQIVHPGGKENAKNPTVVTLKLVPETYYYFISAGSTMHVQRDTSCSALKKIVDIDDLMKEREEDLQADRKVAMWSDWDLARQLFPG